MGTLVGPMLALLSSGLWGGADFLGGLLSRRLRVAAVVGWSQAVGLVAVSLAALGAGSLSDPPGWLWPSLAAGAAGTTGLVCFYAALAAGTMGVVSPIAALGAVVPVLLAVASGEQPGPVQVAGIVVALAGAALASGPELSGARGAGGARPVLLAALAGVGFGLALWFIGLGAQDSPLMTLVGMRATSVTAFVLVALIARSAGDLSRRDAVPVAAVGIADAGANLTFGLAATAGLVSVTAVLASLYPVVTVLLARALLAERLARLQQVGVVAALAGVVLVSAG